MPTTVDIPGVGQVDFPDSMDDAAIEHAINHNIVKRYDAKLNPDVKLVLPQAQPAPKGGDPATRQSEIQGNLPARAIAAAIKSTAQGVAGTASAIMHPMDTYEAVKKNAQAEDEAARKSHEAGDLFGEVAHSVYSVPFVGPGIRSVAEHVKKGEIPEALGEVGAAVYGPRAVSAAAGDVARGVSATASKVSRLPEAARRVMSQPGSNKIAGGAGEIAAGLGSVASGHPAAIVTGAGAIVKGGVDVYRGLAERRAAAMDRLSQMAAPPTAEPVPIRPPIATPVEAPPGVPDPVMPSNMGVIRKVGTPREVLPVAPELAPDSILTPEATAERLAIQNAPQPSAAPYERTPDPFKSGPAFQQGVELMRARRRGAAAVAQPTPSGPQLVPEPPAGEVDLVAPQSTPRSRGELAPGPTGQHQMPLGFSPDSFAAGARDPKMMDLADTLFVAGVEPEIAHLMRAKDWQQTAMVATRMKAEALAAEKGIPVAAAEQMVKPLKVPSADTVKLIVDELKRRYEMLPAGKAEIKAPVVLAPPSKPVGSAIPKAARKAIKKK